MATSKLLSVSGIGDAEKISLSFAQDDTHNAGNVLCPRHHLKSGKLLGRHWWGAWEPKGYGIDSSGPGPVEQVLERIDWRSIQGELLNFSQPGAPAPEAQWDRTPG